jgi:hypothetical protein
MARMKVDALGYCGARCLMCFAYKRTVSEAAKALRRELRAEKLKDSWKEFPFLADYASFKKSLDGLAMLRCTKMCRGGGGNPWCKIRRCAQKREFTGCWECDEAKDCKKLLPAYRPNLDKIRRGGLDRFLAAQPRA